MLLSLRRFDAAQANGRLRKAEPRNPKRQARSVALVMPIRLPRMVDDFTSGTTNLKGALSMRLPLKAPLTPSAWPRRPGPEHSKRKSELPRRRFISAIPVVGSRARIRTPAA